MSAPATTARQTPTGIPLQDGYQTLVAFARAPAVKIWEISVKPPGVDNGEPIPQSTMHNQTWHTDAARALKRLTQGQLKFAYDPKFYDEIMSLCGENGSITVHLPDGGTLDFFGYLKNFEPSENSEGNRPEGTGSIVPTNWDPVNRVEQGPVLTNVSGT